MPNFDFGQNSVPASKPYNPEDYGLPVWRDEDHLPPQETVTAEREPETVDTMTVEAAKRKLCLWAEQQLGYREGVNNWQKYAENPDLQAIYGWKPQNQPWCDMFVDSGFIACFGLPAACAMTYQPLGNGSALCRQSAQYYKDHGAFYHTPELGDQIFFYSSGDINHTGIVVGVATGSVTTIEGNSSDMVAKRLYSVSDSKIAGYGRPNWAVVADGQDTDTDEQQDIEESEKHERCYTLIFPYIQRGSTGETVTAAQIALMGRGYGIGPDGADGDYGGNTESAVKRFQTSVGLTADGIVGPNTGAMLFGGEVYTPEEVKTAPEASSFWNNLLTKIRK